MIASSRRRFLRDTSLATGAIIAGFPALLRSASPNEKLNIAVIGCGGRGGGNLAEVSGENIVALCDVNERPLDAAAAKHPKARKFIDFRKLYDEVKDFDAVLVSCAEHTHAFATLPALQLGKHVYCEKPLTHSIWEARIITERQFPPRGRAGAKRRHRPRARGARVGRTRLGAAKRGGGKAAQGHRPRDRAAEGSVAGAGWTALGLVARPRAGTAVS
jgi:hypothetical protein